MKLQFLRGTDFESRMIEWFSHSGDFSHVDVVWPDGRLFGSRIDTNGDDPKGVQFRDPSYAQGNVALTIDVPMPEAMRQQFCDFLLAQEGKPYDLTGIFGFVADRNWDEPDSWFCSELVAAALSKCGFFPYPLSSPSNKITPADLVLLISATTPVTLQGVQHD